MDVPVLHTASARQAGQQAAVCWSLSLSLGVADCFHKFCLIWAKKDHKRVCFLEIVL